MLTHLEIRNFALVERIDVELRPGMTVLTGETGAGKSILLDALGLALGNRADSGLIRISTVAPLRCSCCGSWGRCWWRSMASTNTSL